MNSHIDRQIIQTAVIAVSFHLILLHVHNMSMHIINLSSKQLSFVIKGLRTIALSGCLTKSYFLKDV